MKLTFLITAFTCLSFAGIAQVTKNTLLVGGNFGAYSYTREFVGDASQQQASQGIGLSVGKAVKENKVAGIVFAYGRQRFSGDFFSVADSTTFLSKQYAAGIFYRQYRSLGRRFFFFGEGTALYNFGNSEESNPSGTFQQSSHQNGAALAFTPGVSYSISKRLGIEISLPDIISASYSSSKGDPRPGGSNEESTKLFSLSSSFSGGAGLGNLGVGFRLFL